MDRHAVGLVFLDSGRGCYPFSRDTDEWPGVILQENDSGKVRLLERRQDKRMFGEWRGIRDDKGAREGSQVSVHGEGRQSLYSATEKGIGHRMRIFRRHLPGCLRSYRAPPARGDILQEFGIPSDVIF